MESNWRNKPVFGQHFRRDDADLLDVSFASFVFMKGTLFHPLPSEVASPSLEGSVNSANGQCPRFDSSDQLPTLTGRVYDRNCKNRKVVFSFQNHLDNICSTDQIHP